jgi:hypothetical protein
MIRRWLPAVVFAACLSAGCFEFFNKSSIADPSSVTVSLLGGTWTTSTSTAGTLGGTCTNFSWQVTESSGSSGSGTFSATCFGDMQVTGSAQGSLSGPTLTWSATATATVAGFPTCNISISGTATLSGDTITIPYSGTTCAGSVSGTEVLKKKS